VLVASLTAAVSRGLFRRERELGPVASVLLRYLQRCRDRLAALHAKHAAGKLPKPPAASRTTRLARPPKPAPEPDPDALPRPVFVDPLAGVPLCRGPQLASKLCLFGPWQGDLRRLVEDPEMAALIAAAPGAGRILRGMWRRLQVDPLPEVLRLPAETRRRRKAAQRQAANREPAKQRQGDKPQGAKPQAAKRRSWPPAPDGRAWPYPDMPPWEWGRRQRARQARAGPKKLA